MSNNQNSNNPLDADATEASTPDMTPALVPDDGDDYEGNGRKPIELDETLNVADLEALFRPKKAKAAAAASEPAAEADVVAGEVVVGDPAREAELQAEVDAQKNNYLRAVADLHNFRRRTDEEIKRIKATANERLIKDFLPIVDDFELSLKAAQNAQSYEQLIGGVEAVLRKFVDTLGKEGVHAIPAVGEAFNPDVHEAVMVDEGADAPDETVTAELRKGYTLHGRVIRPSLVKVAKS